MTARVRPAETKDHDAVRFLFRAYQAWLQQDICFKDFEAELADLSAAYQPPKGGLWVAEQEGEVVGTVALRPLKNGTAELRRLWVVEQARGQDLGRHLATAALKAARAAGYARVQLDTFPFMAAAVALYGALGFRQIENPYKDERLFMALEFDR